MPREKMITKTQSVGFYDHLDAEVQRVADERFKGNFNMAANFLFRLGVDADKATALILEGKTQIDMAAFAGAGNA